MLKKDRYIIIKQLKRRLDKERFEHSLSVSYTAGCLAMAYGENIEKALIAGLLHDYAKNIPIDEQIDYCKRHRIHLSEYELNNPCIIHGKVGALMVMKKYGIKDEDIIGAIYNHVVGKPDMSMLEKIVFVADYIEAERKELPRIDEIRKEAFSNIDKSVAMIYENIINYIKAKNEYVDDESMNAYRFYSGGKHAK